MSFNRLKYFFAIPIIISYMAITGCSDSSIQKRTDQKADESKNWIQEFDRKLPMMGHRNWILIVDKAFPEQNSPGMDYIYTNENLLPVLKQVLSRVNRSDYVNPIIYKDEELDYITEDQAKGVTQFVQDSKIIFGSQQVKTMLHDSVFKQLDAEAKLFKVLVIKTNETIPYTSVFLRLDCAYWNNDKERQLRLRMSTRTK